MKSEFLLKQIADALGMDVEAFGYASDSGSQGATANKERKTTETVDLLRLITAFHALPTSEARREALRLVEEMAGYSGNNAPPRATGKD